MTNSERNDIETAIHGHAYEGCEAVVRLYALNHHDTAFLLIRDKATNCHVKKAAEEILEGKEPTYLQVREQNAAHIA